MGSILIGFGVMMILDSVVTLPFMSDQITASGIALFHSSINLLFSMIMLPMTGLLVKLAVKTIPFTEQEKQEQVDTLQYLDPLLLRNPGLAIAQARKAAGAVAGSVQDSFSAWLDGHMEETEQYCLRTKRYLSQSEAYLTKLTKKQLLENDSREIKYLQQICGDFTIISQQIALLAKNHEAAAVLCNASADDLRVYGGAVRETLEIVAEGFEVRSDQIAGIMLAYDSIAFQPMDQHEQKIQKQRNKQIRILFRDKYNMLKK